MIDADQTRPAAPKQGKNGFARYTRSHGSYFFRTTFRKST